MGGKRDRKGKYLCLSIAGVMFFYFTGCAALREMEKKEEARECLLTAQELLGKGDYAAALRENRKALSMYGHTPPGDEALFNTGLIYAHHGYSEKDYGKSVDLFKRLVHLFPRSPFAGRAAIWISVLTENEKLKGEVEGLNKALKESRQLNKRLNREIEELNKAIRKSRQIDIEIEEKKKELSE